jgi:hypothetical protein
MIRKKKTTKNQLTINPQSAPIPHDPAREQSIRELITSVYPRLRAALLSDSIARADAFEVEGAITVLTDKFLGTYPGELNPDSLFIWTYEATLPTVRAAALYRQYNRAVFRGIWKILKNSADLLEWGIRKPEACEAFEMDGHDARIIAASFWHRFIIKRLDLKLDANRENNAAWFVTMGRYEAMAWRTDRIRIRGRFEDVDDHEGTFAVDVEGNHYVNRNGYFEATA